MSTCGTIVSRSLHVANCNCAVFFILSSAYIQSATSFLPPFKTTQVRKQDGERHDTTQKNISDELIISRQRFPINHMASSQRTFSYASSIFAHPIQLIRSCFRRDLRKRLFYSSVSCLWQ